MTQQFDPYRKWLGIPREKQPPHHYQLLGIADFEDDPDVIENAANRQMAHVRSFQTGEHGQKSQELLNELAQAKICLLQMEAKSVYDADLKAKLTPVPPPPNIATAAHPGMAPMATAASEVATPVRPNPSPETAVPVRAENPLNSLPGQSRSGSNPISRRARKRNRNPAIPWLLAFGALTGVAVLIAILYYLLMDK